MRQSYTSNMNDAILLPTDGSRVSIKATRYANKLAQAFDSEVHILCVQEVVGISDAIQGVNSRPTDTEAEEYIERAEERINNDVEVTEVTREGGNAANVILEYAENSETDHIVMGTTGRTGAERFLIGSVAEKVVRQSEYPVTTIQESDKTDEDGEENTD